MARALQTSSDDHPSTSRSHRTILSLDGSVSMTVRSLSPSSLVKRLCSGDEPGSSVGGVQSGPVPVSAGRAPMNDALRPSRTPVSYTHLRAHETPEQLVCRLLLEKKKK